MADVIVYSRTPGAALDPRVGGRLSDSIGAGGMSSNNTNKKARVFAMWDLFVEYRASCDAVIAPWIQLTQAKLCETQLYERFAFYMTRVYLTSTGGYLMFSTIQNYLRCIMNLAMKKCQAMAGGLTGWATDFFSCLNPSAKSDSWKWFVGVQHNIERICFVRATKNGDNLDRSCPPIYLPHINWINQAYSWFQSGHAAQSRFTLTCAWQSTGRASETA